MNLIINDIESQLQHYPESKFVITGLDRSGKSYFLNFFGKYRTYKDNRSLPIHPGDINWRFRVYDRYPLIESFACTYGYETGDVSDDHMIKYIIGMMKSEFRNSVFLFNYYPRYRNLRDDDDDRLQGLDEFHINRYHKIAMAILNGIEGVIVIERYPNKIVRYQNGS